jgi:hypothetical protein
MKCILLLFCCAVVAALYMATIRVCLHDVYLMLERVESAHGGEGGAPGQHTWHTQCSFLINRNTYVATEREEKKRKNSRDITRAVALSNVHPLHINFKSDYTMKSPLLKDRGRHSNRRGGCI